MYLLALLGLFTGRNDRFSYPFMYFNLSPNPFITPWSLKKVPLLRLPVWAIIGSTPPPLPRQQYFIPGAFTFPSSSVPVIHSWCLYFGVIWKESVFLEYETFMANHTEAIDNCLLLLIFSSLCAINKDRKSVQLLAAFYHIMFTIGFLFLNS